MKEMVDQYGFIRAQLFTTGLLVHWDIAIRDEIIEELWDEDK